MDWFDLSTKTETKREYLARVKYDQIITAKTKNFKDAIGEDFEENVQYRLVTENSFNAIVVIDFVLEKFEIQEIFIAVYRMNYQAVLRLKNIISEKKIPTQILLSSFFRENKRYERWCADLIAFSNSFENVEVKFAHTHAKVFLAKTVCGKYFVFEGSGNLSDNARIEQYIFENNKTVYDFHKEWILNTLD